MSRYFFRNIEGELLSLLLLVPVLLTACMFELSDDIGDCGPEDEDYPECRPVAPDEVGNGGDAGMSEEVPDGTGDEQLLVVRRDYLGSGCLSGAGTRIVVGHDNDGDGTLLTELDERICVGVGDSLSGGVGIGLCWEPAVCFGLGIDFDGSMGLGIKVCLSQEACLEMGIPWTDAAPSESRLCWDPDSDLSVSSDEILYEGIICRRPEPCGEGGLCRPGLICSESDECVVPPPEEDCGEGEGCGDGEAP